MAWHTRQRAGFCQPARRPSTPGAALRVRAGAKTDSKIVSVTANQESNGCTNVIDRSRCQRGTGQAAPAPTGNKNHWGFVGPRLEVLAGTDPLPRTIR